MEKNMFGSSEPEDEIYQVSIKPLEGYIESSNYDEAFLALKNILVECIYAGNMMADSNSNHIVEAEAEALGWNGSSLYSIIRDINELGQRIDLEKNIKCGAYAACKLYQEVYGNNITLLYEKYAQENSSV
jgi:hypothetical protein